MLMYRWGMLLVGRAFLRIPASGSLAMVRELIEDRHINRSIMIPILGWFIDHWKRLLTVSGWARCVLCLAVVPTTLYDYNTGNQGYTEVAVLKAPYPLQACETHLPHTEIRRVMSFIPTNMTFNASHCLLCCPVRTSLASNLQ